MKKILIIITAIVSLNMIAETYRLTITSKHLDEKSIAIKDAEGNDINKPLTCELPEVLNEAGDACITPPPVCEHPLVLNEAGDACFNSIEDVGWIYTEGDSCNGMRQASFDSRVYFARARTGSYSTSYQIPKGYKWLTKQEYNDLFVASTVPNKTSLGYKYYGRCGIGGYPSINGQNQYVLLLNGNGGSGIHTGQQEHYGTNSYPHFISVSGSNVAGYVLYREE